MIERQALQEMFDNLHSHGVDTEAELLWGYFFTHADASRLQAVVPTLERIGYRFVEIFQAEVDDDVTPYFFLHVEKVESHTVDSLFDRNLELHAFADENGLDSYDGMDVGRPDGQPLSK